MNIAVICFFLGKVLWKLFLKNFISSHPCLWGHITYDVSSFSWEQAVKAIFSITLIIWLLRWPELKSISSFVQSLLWHLDSIPAQTHCHRGAWWAASPVFAGLGHVYTAWCLRKGSLEHSPPQQGQFWAPEPTSPVLTHTSLQDTHKEASLVFTIPPGVCRGNMPCTESRVRNSVALIS